LHVLQTRGLRLYVASCFAVHARDRRLQALGDVLVIVVLVALGIEFMVLAEQLQRVDLTGELKPDAANLAGVLAAASRELLDDHLG
jgi:hypothetical protein